MAFFRCPTCGAGEDTFIDGDCPKCNPPSAASTAPKPASKLPGEKLKPHAAIRADICYDCHGPLRGADGGYCERLEEVGAVGFAVGICLECKHKAWEAQQQEQELQQPKRRIAPMGRLARRKNRK